MLHRFLLVFCVGLCSSCSPLQLQQSSAASKRRPPHHWCAGEQATSRFFIFVVQYSSVVNGILNKADKTVLFSVWESVKLVYRNINLQIMQQSIVLRWSPTLCVFIWLWLTASTLDAVGADAALHSCASDLSHGLYSSVWFIQIRPADVPHSLCNFYVNRSERESVDAHISLMSVKSVPQSLFRVLSIGWREITPAQRTIGELVWGDEMGVKWTSKCKSWCKCLSWTAANANSSINHM